MTRIFALLIWAAAWTASFRGSLAFPADIVDADPFEGLNTTLFDSDDAVALQKRDKAELRILPLGASIVWGKGSSDQNGFRKGLRDQLRYKGWEVNMVGSQNNGNMKDSDVEAHSGDTINQVKAASKASLDYLPNVIVINAGTNDCVGSIDIPNAGNRMRALIEEAIDYPGMEKTTIVLSTVLASADDRIERNRPSVNNQYRRLVTDMRSEGRKIVLADMDPEAPHPANGWFKYPAEMDDKIHPNDAGFKKMAYIFYRGIMKASSDGLLEEPNSSPALENPSSGNCEKKFGSGTPVGVTQQGSGQDDGLYYHSSDAQGSVLTIKSEWDRDHFRFAKLFRRSRDDLVAWWKRGDDVLYGVWRNTGNAKDLFVKISDMSVQNNCGINGVHFADFNADGLDDFICIGKDGAMYVSINQGDGTSSKPPSFKSIGQVMAAKSGYIQARVRVGDIDGDGRSDYCVIESNGDIRCWRNGGSGDRPKRWQDIGGGKPVFKGKNMGNMEGVRFYDVNGDGRDDWVWVSDAGAVTTWTNVRSCGKNKLVTWRQGFAKGKSSGPTHPGMGGKDKRDSIHFARIYNSVQDVGLYGKADYVYIEHHKEKEGHRFEVKVWKNTGGGGTKMLADGNRYCNMKGASSGRDDYVWIHSHGIMSLYPNFGRNKVSKGQSFWGPVEKNIFSPGKTLDRRDLHLVDWDGDGACDVVWTDPENKNHVELWLNQYPKTKTWQWKHNANPAPQLSCNEKRGVGIFDRPVAFADMTGNGRGDYLCMDKEGRTGGFIHQSDGSWEKINQFKKPVGADRENLRWADVNGDGRADMIWVNKFTGDGTVYYNWDRAEVGGSQFDWRPKGRLYQGAVGGACTYFPDLDGDGRADMHAISGSWTNKAQSWLNTCGGDVTGDDANSLEDPNLPVQPGSDADDDGGGGGGGDGDGDDKGGDVSRDGRCGADFGNSVSRGSEFGNCCSADGRCGPGVKSCGAGCQTKYGICATEQQTDDGGMFYQWPGDYADDVCSLRFDSTDAEETSFTWIKSGAIVWFRDFLQAEGADKWADRFFQMVIAGGSQGGSTYDCGTFSTGANCPMPLGNTCADDYTPPEAFYVHLQMAHLYSAYQQVWTAQVGDAIEQLASGIKDIVDTWGTPPEDDNPMILNMLVGIFTSLAGMGGVGAPLSTLANPLTFMAGVFAQLSASSGEWDVPMSADDLNDKLENIYGHMFGSVINSTYAIVEDFFNGRAPDDTNAEDWVFAQFATGQWLSKEIVNPLVKDYVRSSREKWREFATVRAMKTGNKGSDYFLMVSDDETECTTEFSSKPITEAMCKGHDACIWHDKRCVCLGSTPNGGGNIISGVRPLPSDELKKLKKYISNYEAALHNNYRCMEWSIKNPDACDGNKNLPKECSDEDMEKPHVPDRDNFDLQHPIEYPKCFFNFAPAMGTKFKCSAN